MSGTTLLRRCALAWVLGLGVTPALAQPKFPVVLDYAGYRLAPDQDTSYAEFYYGIWRDKLTFAQVPDDTVWQAEFEVRLVLTDTAGVPVDSLRRSLATRVASEAEAKRRDVTIFDVMALLLPPGTYRATLTVTDLVGEVSGATELDTVQIRRFGNVGDSLVMSDLQLAYRIDYVADTLVARTAQKVKNSYYIEPNPAGLYAPEDSVLYFYGELYNLPPEPTSYRVRMWILNTAGDIVKNIEPRFAPRLGESALLTYGLAITDLKPGLRYQLAVEVDFGDHSVSSRKYFWLGSGAASPTASAEEPFTDADARFNEQFLAHIATTDEMREYRALSLEGKRRFLYDFWARHDSDRSTPENEFYREHARRFAIANERFARSLTRRDDGWNTDRGRIYILYGPPDDIIYSSSSIGSLPWERWEYRQLEGGVYFIFLDENNLGFFRLVHSNKQGEKQDPDWEEKIQREGIDIINR